MPLGVGVGVGVGGWDQKGTFLFLVPAKKLRGWGEEEGRRGKVWMRPPTLLSLAIDSALRHITRITDLSEVPEPVLLELFVKILHAGKLTEKVLKLFIATGSEEILSFIQSLNIQQVVLPILPTRCSEKF